MMGIAPSINSWRTWRTPHWDQIKCSFGICIIPGGPRWKHWYQIKCKIPKYLQDAQSQPKSQQPSHLVYSFYIFYISHSIEDGNLDGIFWTIIDEMKVSDNFQMRMILTSERNPVRVGINILVVVTWKQAIVNIVLDFSPQHFVGIGDRTQSPLANTCLSISLLLRWWCKNCWKKSGTWFFWWKFGRKA